MFGFLPFLLSLHLKIARTYSRKQTTQKNSIFATLYHHGQPTNQTLQFTFPDSTINIEKDIIEPDVIIYIKLWPFLCMIMVIIIGVSWFVYKKTNHHQSQAFPQEETIMLDTTTPTTTNASKTYTYESPPSPVSLLIWNHQLPSPSLTELEELETFTTALPSRGGGLTNE